VKTYLAGHSGLDNVLAFTSKLILEESTSGVNTETDDDFVKGTVFPGSEIESEGTPHFLDSSPTVYLDASLGEVSYDLDIGNQTSQTRIYDTEAKPLSGGMVRHGGSGLLGVGLYSYDKSDVYRLRYARTRDFSDRYRGMSPHFQGRNNTPVRRGDYTRTTYVVFGNTQEIEDTFKALHNYFQVAQRHRPVARLNSSVGETPLELASNL